VGNQLFLDIIQGLFADFPSFLTSQLSILVSALDARLLHHLSHCSIACEVPSGLPVIGYTEEVPSGLLVIGYYYIIDRKEADVQCLCQLHQFFITCNTEAGLRSVLPASILDMKDTLGSVCKVAFLSVPVQHPARQQQVSNTLRDIGLAVEDEFRCPKSGYSIDMWVQDKREQGTSGNIEVGWAIEFDGPSYFLASKAPTGATLIKRWHLEQLGYRLVSVSYW
jgi:hypothetical protein